MQKTIDKALIRCVTLFIITWLSVFLVYGYQWSDGNPLSDGETALQSAMFAGSLMFILLSHEMGHYWVAKRHGFSLSLPYFIPFPFAFGTLGAVIRLKSMPKDRNALLEMGAAGPIAGFVAAIITAAIGMLFTQNHLQVELPIEIKDQLVEQLAQSAQEPWYIELLSFIGLIPNMEPNSIPLTILSDPILLKGFGYLYMGEPLSPYAQIHPMAFAAWVGCLLTAINMLPIGQLDGGHICHAIFPKQASKIARLCIGVLFLGVFMWLGWLVWACMLLFMGATRGIAIENGTLSIRAKYVAFAAIISFLLSFMVQPVRIENVPLEDIKWIEGARDIQEIKKGD